MSTEMVVAVASLITAVGTVIGVVVKEHAKTRMRQISADETRAKIEAELREASDKREAELEAQATAREAAAATRLIDMAGELAQDIAVTLKRERNEHREEVERLRHAHADDVARIEREGNERCEARFQSERRAMQQEIEYRIREAVAAEYRAVHDERTLLANRVSTLEKRVNDIPKLVRDVAAVALTFDPNTVPTAAQITEFRRVMANAGVPMNDVFSLLARKDPAE